MKILRLHLENFQGVKDFEICPDGESCSVYGDNGTGKSTIYNAFTWLMYGKPSTAEKNYTPKTTGSHNLHHSVEMTAQLDDGAVIVLKKDYHEVYKTVKGSAQAVLSGHTTDYAVDGVPVNETQFKKILTGIYKSEDLAKMLTMYDYFLDAMKIADRRKVLLQVCGDVEMEDVIGATPELAELPELLRKPGNTRAMYTVEEYQAIAAKEKSLVDKEMKDIPHRIDEAEKAKPDTAGMDKSAIEMVIGSLKEAQRNLESQRAAGEDVAETAIRQNIAKLESQQAEAGAKYAKAEAEKNKGAYERISNLRYMKSDIETAIMHAEQDRQEHENELSRLKRRRESLLQEWQEEDEREWSGNEICPTCKRPLPEEQIAQAIEAFNIAKAQRLEEINQRGMKQCSAAMIKAEQEEIDRLDLVITEKKEKKAEIEKSLEAAERTVVAVSEYTDTKQYLELKEKIDGEYKKLKDLKLAAADADNEISGRIRELDSHMAAEMRKLAALDLVEKQDARIAELGEREKELASKYEQLQAGLHMCEVYTRAKAKMLDDKINHRFKTLRFRLFIEQQNGGIADDCEALVPCATGLVPFKSANNAARINAGLELIDTLAEYYRVQLPVFIDNAESVTRIQRTNTQVIRLVVSEQDKALRFEKGDI